MALIRMRAAPDMSSSGQWIVIKPTLFPSCMMSNFPPAIHPIPSKLEREARRLHPSSLDLALQKTSAQVCIESWGR